MSRRARFFLIFAPETIEHPDVIERKYHRVIQQAVDVQLSHTPDRVTRNRKRLEEPTALGATWELRCGPRSRFRVFYEIDNLGRRVVILTIGVKEGNRLMVGGEEIEL